MFNPKVLIPHSLTVQSEKFFLWAIFASVLFEEFFAISKFGLSPTVKKLKTKFFDLKAGSIPIADFLVLNWFASKYLFAL